MTYTLISFFLSLAGFLALMWLKNAESNSLKKYFIIYAGKSKSDAILLGGLPLALGSLAGAVICLKSEYTYLSMISSSLINFYVLSSIIVGFCGYMDDLSEVRPILKLIFQFVTVSLFSLFGSQLISQDNSFFAFSVLFVLGMGNLNGVNLLDGMDTMTIKISSGSFLCYYFIGSIFQIPSLLFLGPVFLAPLLAYYAFNRHPSKLHLGEIGGAFIGLSYLFLSTLTFIELIKSISHFDAFAIILLPMMFPLTELFISFTRRLIKGRSPFSGDHFHIHHLLHNYYGFSISKTTNILGVLNAFMALTPLYLIKYYNIPILPTFLGMSLGLVSIYYLFGSKFWFKIDAHKRAAEDLLEYVKKKEIGLMENNIIDIFEFKITPAHEEEHLDQELSSVVNLNKKDSKNQEEAA